MNLLERIFETGEKMRSALESERFDEYLGLVAERGTLLDSLQSYEHPSQIDADWQIMKGKLTEQHELLMASASSYEDRMRESLLRLERTKGATRSYNPPPKQRNILNENLRI